MAESVNNKLTNIADAIRSLSDTTDKLSLAEMAAEIDAANAELEEQLTLIEEIAALVETKSSPDDEVERQAELIAEIKTAAENLPELNITSEESGWTSLAYLPTTYALAPTGATYYLGIDDNTICILVYQIGRSVICFPIVSGQVGIANSPYIPYPTIVAENGQQYCAITHYEEDDPATIYVLSIQSPQNGG